MKKLACLTAIFAASLIAMCAHAEPVQLAAQGRLISSSGGPASDGNYAISIGLYPQAQGGIAVFEEPFLAVAVQGGVFSVTLGAAKYPLDSAVLASGQPLWVAVTVGTDELSRVPLQRVPSAVHALVAKTAADLKCSGCVEASDLAAGAVTAEKIALGAVGANHVSFSWALADAPGGAANFALAANTAKLADQAKLADTASYAEEAGSAKGLQCTGCVSTTALADGAVTAKKLAAGVLDWKALADIPAGFADGIDDTLSDADAVKAVTKASINLAAGTTMATKPLARMGVSYNGSLGDGKSMTLDSGIGLPTVIAQAWFYEPTGKTWIQANTGTTGTASCSDCGTGADGVFNPASNTTLAANKVWQFSQFTIPSGVVVTVTGAAALDLKVSGKVLIAGTLLLDGGAAVDTTPGANGCSGNVGASTPGAAGPGGFAGGSTSYGNLNAVNGDGPGGGIGAGNGQSYGNGGGGGGAGYGTGGTAGNNAGSTSTAQPGGAGGPTYVGISNGTLQGGSGGGAGGYGTAYNSGGAGGGGGGGAVRIQAPEIVVTGKISANGGKGGAMIGGCDGGAGGGGAGGAIWLRGGKVDFSAGILSAIGGQGGSIDAPAGSDGGAGGAGGAGKVRVDSPTAVLGNSTPAFEKGQPTGISAPVVNSFAIDQPTPGAVRLTNNSGATQQVYLLISY